MAEGAHEQDKMVESGEMVETDVLSSTGGKHLGDGRQSEAEETVTVTEDPDMGHLDIWRL